MSVDSPSHKAAAEKALPKAHTLGDASDGAEVRIDGCSISSASPLAWLGIAAAAMFFGHWYGQMLGFPVLSYSRVSALPTQPAAGNF